jgi:hypothetical protein
MQQSIAEYVMENGVIQLNDKLKEEVITKEEMIFFKKEYASMEFLERVRVELMKNLDNLMAKIQEID